MDQANLTRIRTKTRLANCHGIDFETVSLEQDVYYKQTTDKENPKADLVTHVFLTLRTYVAMCWLWLVFCSSGLVGWSQGSDCEKKATGWRNGSGHSTDRSLSTKIEKLIKFKYCCNFPHSSYLRHALLGNAM